MTFAEMLLEMVEGRPGSRSRALVAAATVAAATVAAAVAGASLPARGRR